MFKLNDREMARRLDEFRDADPADLNDEIALCRLLAEQAVNEGHPARAAQLLSVTGKLELLQIAARERMGALLDRHSLFEVGRAICQAIMDHCAGLPNYEQIVDAVLPAIREAIATAGRDKKTPLLLTTEENSE